MTNTIESRPLFRTFLVDQITPALPKGWRFEPYRTNHENITRPTVYANLQSVDRSPQAPRAAFQVKYLLSVWSPAKYVEKELDEDLLSFLTLLDELRGVAWSNTRSVVNSDQTSLGFDIDLTFTVSKTTTPDKES